jgi:hypothetical protein
MLISLIYKNAKIELGGSDDANNKLNGLRNDLTQNYVSALRAMHGETQSRGIPLVLSTFIVKYRRDQERQQQIANADVAFYYMPWMSIDDLLDGTDAYNKAVLEFGRAHGVPVVDERECIPADAEHFVDCVHLADKGCVLMADRFLRFLESHELVRQVIKKRKLGP